MLNAEEFIAAVAAVHRFLQEDREKPLEIRRGISYWKLLSKLRRPE
jgi:hypothetical protein